MKKADQSNVVSVNDKIDGVLSNASPRPAPRSDRKAKIYSELRSEWQANVSATHRKQRYVVTGIAASILAAILISLQIIPGLQESPLAPEALLARSTGNGTTLNGHPVEGLIPINAPLHFRQGDELSTGPGAAVAVAWHSLGSLRISSSSTLVFTSFDRVELVEGSMYYDSGPLGMSDSSAIIVDTRYGQILHVGTQFIAGVDSSGVHISVREGEVSFADGGEIIAINAGQSAYVDKSFTTNFAPISATDPSWNWASAIAPERDIDGRSTHEIIEWISRETGRVIEYKSAAAEAYAENDKIFGIGEIEPIRAMSIIPIATGLQFEVDQDSIRIGIME